MKKVVFGVGIASFLAMFVFGTFTNASDSCGDSGKGGGGTVKGKGSIEECEEKEDKKGEGDLRVAIKVYDCNGNKTGEVIEKSKVKLYDKKGKRVDEDKTNFKGEANFYDIEEGKYRVKCEVPGYVNSKEPHKDYYRTNLVKVKDDDRAEKTCHIRKAGACTAANTVKNTTIGVQEEKLAQTGQGLIESVKEAFGL